MRSWHFGARLWDSNDHPKRAVLCALDMMEELGKLREKWRSEGKTVIDIGIGISTGEMIIGNMGSKDKMDYTVIGDTVNLGSRLEGLNKDYNTNIIGLRFNIPGRKGPCGGKSARFG